MKTNIILIIYRSFLLRMRNVSEKSCTENQNTHFVFSIFLSKMYHLWDNVESPGITRQTTDVIRRMRIASCITKATNTQSEYVIFVPFPLQQCLHECASMLCYTNTECHVVFKVLIRGFSYLMRS